MGTARNLGRRVAESKRQAEMIASRKAEVEFNERMDGQVDEMVAGGNEGPLNRIRSLLAERGQFPEDLRIRSTDTLARIAVLQADPLQLGAPQPPPLQSHGRRHQRGEHAG